MKKNFLILALSCITVTFWSCKKDAEIKNLNATTLLQEKTTKATVNILVKVDTEKLLRDYPKGGMITRHDIIEMTDNQPDSYYEGGFRDKLHTMLDWNDNVFWTISSVNGEKLEFVDCVSDANLLKVVNEKPKPYRDDDKSVWMVKVKEVVTVKVKPWYTFSFKLKDNNNLIWSWDPTVESRKP